MERGVRTNEILRNKSAPAVWARTPATAEGSLFQYARLRDGRITSRQFPAAFTTLIVMLFALLPHRDALAAIAVSKSIAPTYSGTIFPGDITAFRITLTNDNPVSQVNN